MNDTPLARLDAYLPAALPGGAMGFVQHLSLSAADVDLPRPLPEGQDTPFDLVCRDDLRIPLRGVAGRPHALPSGLFRQRVVLGALDGAARTDLTALLSSLRKAAHLALARDADVEAASIASGLDRYRLPHDALPELHADDVDTSVVLLGRRLRSPVVISAMTGGSSRGGDVNRRLAEVAQAAGIAMGLGSQRAMHETRALAGTFRVRDVAPDVLLLANVGAVQLNGGLGVDDVRALVEEVGADALCVHLNVLQEMVQPEGDRDFRGLEAKIGALVRALPVPVVLKETGAGISGSVAARARDLGVAALDVGGAGGTSWGYIEGLRTREPHHRAVGETFRDWGIPTAEALVECRAAAPDLPLVATGGVRNGRQIAVAVALGATAAGLALPFLRAVERSPDEGHRLAERLAREVRIAMLCAGARDVAALRRVPLRPSQEVR